jgi:general stress protein 26
MRDELAEVGEIKAACLEVMRVSEAVYVTTLDSDGSPFTRAMFNLRRAEQFPAFTALFRAHDATLLAHLSTNTSSRKVAQLRADPRASLYYCVPGTFHGVMLSGEAVLDEDPALKQALWLPNGETYYPLGVSDPDYTVVSLRPRRLRGWLGGRPFDVSLAVPA